MTGPLGLAVAAATAGTLGGPLFFGPLTPILLFLVPLVVLAAVVYVVYKILT